MLRKILLGVAAAIVVLVIVIATRPATFHVERSITIAAPPEAAFAQVDDFHAWQAWSPWEKLDPGMKRSFGGSPSGRGATYAWAGNDEVGEGRMTIVEAAKPAKIAIRLEFLEPFAATNDITFTFVPAAAGSRVTWAMDGKNNFLSKAFHLFMNADSMIGTDFERGLSGLKAAAEKAAKAGGPAASAVP